MKPEDLQLMHEVLDGEASADDARVLNRLLAADPDARAEYEELRRLFEGLNSIRTTAPPDGLIAGCRPDATPAPAASSIAPTFFTLACTYFRFESTEG